VFTHTAFPEANDAVAARLWPYLDRVPAIELLAVRGDVIVIHNHRMLHGRRAFDDPRREFVRLLVWRHAPYPAPATWQSRVRAAGVSSAADPEACRRLGVVLELLRGVPPGVLSLREGISEPQLYSWRDAALGTALRALRPEAED
jgi:hypothetical protein